MKLYSLWYEQPTARHVEIGKASLRLVTDFGHWHQDVDLSREAYQEAQEMARQLPANFVVAHELRETVAEWAGEGERQ